MRRLVRRENASPGLDLSACVQHAQAEVDVCVAREPHGLDEGSSNESAMVTVCTVVGTVAVGCSRAGSTVVLGSLYFLSLFGPSGAATRQRSEECVPPRGAPRPQKSLLSALPTAEE